MNEIIIKPFAGNLLKKGIYRIKLKLKNFALFLQNFFQGCH